MGRSAAFNLGKEIGFARLSINTTAIVTQSRRGRGLITSNVPFDLLTSD